MKNLLKLSVVTIAAIGMLTMVGCQSTNDIQDTNTEEPKIEQPVEKPEEKEEPKAEEPKKEEPKKERWETISYKEVFNEAQSSARRKAGSEVYIITDAEKITSKEMGFTIFNAEGVGIGTGVYNINSKQTQFTGWCSICGDLNHFDNECPAWAENHTCEQCGKSFEGSQSGLCDECGNK